MLVHGTGHEVISGFNAVVEDLEAHDASSDEDEEEGVIQDFDSNMGEPASGEEARTVHVQDGKEARMSPRAT